MNTAKVLYLGDLRTQATHLRSGEWITTDAPIDNQGKGEYFSPTDLVASALGSCMLTVMGIKARDLNVDFKGSTAAVTKIMNAEPRRIGAIEIVFEMVGVLEQKDKTIEIKKHHEMFHYAHSNLSSATIMGNLMNKITINFVTMQMKMRMGKKCVGNGDSRNRKNILKDKRCKVRK